MNIFNTLALVINRISRDENIRNNPDGPAPYVLHTTYSVTPITLHEVNLENLLLSLTRLEMSVSMSVIAHEEIEIMVTVNNRTERVSWLLGIPLESQPLRTLEILKTIFAEYVVMNELEEDTEESKYDETN